MLAGMILQGRTSWRCASFCCPTPTRKVMPNALRMQTSAWAGASWSGKSWRWTQVHWSKLPMVWEKAEIQMQLVGRIKIYQDRYIMIYQDHPSPNLDTSVPKQDTPGTSRRMHLSEMGLPDMKISKQPEDCEMFRATIWPQHQYPSISIKDAWKRDSSREQNGARVSPPGLSVRTFDLSVSKFECRLYIFGINHPSPRKCV